MKWQMLLLSLLAPSVAFAKLPPFDFTGTWSGTIVTQGQTGPVDATYTQTSSRRFHGTMDIAFLGVANTTTHCQIKGLYARPITLHARCNDGGATVHGHLDVATSTITIGFTTKHRGRVRMSLTKDA